VRKMGVEEHKKHGADLKLYCGVITISDTRGHLNDISGKSIIDSLSAAGHMPLYYKVVRDDKDAIINEIELALGQEGLKALVINGGSGIGPRDVTIEAVQPFLEKELPGFGELFRMLSYEEIGSAAMMSRAVAGIARGIPVFVLPGSPKAVALAVDKLILPELGHLIHELTRQQGEGEEIPCGPDESEV
jgi:molybdenum cofactor biosynthesis protein B